MAKALFRIPGKIATVLGKRDGACSIAKALIDIWQGHRRPVHKARMRAQMTRKATDEQGSELWSTPLGDLWVPSGSDLATVLSEILQGVYLSPSGCTAVRPGDVVLDCGAHVGAFCRHALRAGAAKVIAIEITPDTRACLERNLGEETRNGTAVIVSEGVWDKEDTLDLCLAEGSLSNTVVGARSEAIGGRKTTSLRVPVTTIDRLVERLNLARVDLIKMDIEGAERQALSGAERVLGQFAPRLAIAAYHLPDDRAAISSVVKALRAEYREELGQCLILHGHVLPETLFYC